MKREAGVLENLYSGTSKRFATQVSKPIPKITSGDILYDP
jgi:hypothetical protein